MPEIKKVKNDMETSRTLLKVLDNLASHIDTALGALYACRFQNSAEDWRYNLRNAVKALEKKSM
jgi:hypothetical protein